MGWLKSVLSANWFRFALFGVVPLAAIAFGVGYMKGYNSAERHYLQEMNRAMKAQYEQLRNVRSKDLAIAVKEAERSNDIRKRLSDLTLSDDCSAVFSQCMQSFNNGVLATGTNPQGVDD
jgi:hypothetical protein